MRNRFNKGFTVAETLIVTAIIMALAAVAFIGVGRYQRSLARLEYDGIAKEIFVAAQNHLTMAEEQGFLGVNKFGSQADDEKDQGIYYYVVNKADAFTGDTTLDLMLPFAAVDETVRAGGSYIIRYQKSPALVLDVFFSREGDRFGRAFAEGDYASVLGVRDVMDADGNVTTNNKNSRQNFDGKVIGWYGGENPDAMRGQRLDTPEIQIKNAERLTVTVKDRNDTYAEASLRLIITGESSEAQKYFDLAKTTVSNITYTKDDAAKTGTYTVVLDDITAAGQHFAELFTGDHTKGTFLPGENITVQAVSFSTTKLTNVAYGGEQTTNSLFASAAKSAEGDSNPYDTAKISNIRHLENLDDTLSGLSYNGDKVKITKAVQTTDLNWETFQNKIKEAKSAASTATVKVYKTGETASGGTKENCFYPVSPSYALSYDGKSGGKDYHSIRKVKVEVSGPAGLFGTLKGSGTGSTAEKCVQNLMLVDFDIKSTANNAGALAGVLQNGVIANVAARHSGREATVTVVGGSSVGGLIGSSTGSKVTKCAAALVVNSTGGNAGGLIGTAAGGSIELSYAGGHTETKKDDEDNLQQVVYNSSTLNVTSAAASGIAGGLVGECKNNISITDSYSTCSVKGATAGGLVGSGAGTTVTDCYATGLVQGTTTGAFAGSAVTLAGQNYYYILVNEQEDIDDKGTEDTGDDVKKGYKYMDPIAGVENPGSSIKGLDEDASTYNTFVGDPVNWKKADPYNGTLVKYYQEKYNLQTVAQLGTGVEETDLVAVHYGDWPAPEIFVFNTANS